MSRRPGPTTTARRPSRATHTRRVRRRRGPLLGRRRRRGRRLAQHAHDVRDRGGARVDAIAAPSTRRPRHRHRHKRQTQVHAAFDVQDTEAWSNADDLRTPSEVKAELARLRQLALACVTAKMDNKKVNDKIDLNARARRPVVSISLP